VVLTKDNLAKRKWKGCIKVASVQGRSLFDICFLIVPWPSLCGG
jgi:hypothetical protein